MQVKKLLTDDEGVSPVIGVILMVAITVILAAVIAAFVLGIGDTDDPAPSASLEYEADESNGQIDISHDSGDSFAAGDAVISVSQDSGSSYNDGVTLNDVTSLGEEDQFSPGDEIAVGSSSPSSGPSLASATSSSNTITIELVWAPGGGDAQSVFSSDTLRNVGLEVA